MKLWLDDLRDPKDFDRPDWVWVKTADEAIAAFQAGNVTEASLDYNLEDLERSGYEVVLWLKESFYFWPPLGVSGHSSSKKANEQMQKVIDNYYKNRKQR